MVDRISGLKVLGTLVSAIALALVLSALVTFLPENTYLRWRQLDGTIYGGLRWTYERIHFDPRPIDVAIVGPSRSQLGLGASMIEDHLKAAGRPVHVANFSIEGTGRNLQWAIVDEIFKAKAPKIIVVEVDAEPYFYGHPAFRYVAPAKAVVSPPQPFLHDYFKSLAYLPSRKVKLFVERAFQDATGWGNQFDPEAYRDARTDFTSTFTAEGKVIDMDREWPRDELIAQTPPRQKATRFARFTEKCCNEGDDHVYIRELAREAKAHGAELMFIYLPSFNDSRDLEDRAFLQQFGTVIDNKDLANDNKIYENWSHLNHAGAKIASERLSTAILPQL